MKLRALMFLAMVVLALALAGCGGGSDDSSGATAESLLPPGGSAAESVEIADFAYQPEEIVVKAGGKVTWTNEDTAPHTVTSVDGRRYDTGTIRKGESASLEFPEPGLVFYFCEIHPTMQGMVEVVE